MSDLVVAVLQLSCCSSRDDPAQSLAVGFPALGSGIFDQALGHKLPHAHQIPIFNLEDTKTNIKMVTRTFIYKSRPSQDG